MIVRMKHVGILCLSSKKHEITSALREIGVLHLETTERSNNHLEDLRAQSNILRQALNLIPIRKPIPGKQNSSPEEAMDIAQRIIDRANLIRQKEVEMEAVKKEIARVEPWGDFQPGLFKNLRDSGLNISLADLSHEELESLPENSSYIILKKRGKRFFLLLFDAEGLDLDFFSSPLSSLSELRQNVQTLKQELNSLKEDLASFNTEREVLQAHSTALESNLEFALVQSSITDTDACPQVALIEGFIPVPKIDDLCSCAGDNGLGLMIRDPFPEENVPTLIHNPRAVRISRPLFQFMDTLPGYHEHDISFWFLTFFTLFFAMIIGDAGYGMLLCLVSLGVIIRKRLWRGASSELPVLLFTLGLGTVFWGAISGNWFGHAAFGDIPFLKQFIIPQLDAFAEGATADLVVETLLLFCFSLGLGHIVLAHLLSMVRKLGKSPRIHALADLGWIAVMLGLYFFVLNLVVESEKFPIPSITIPLLCGGLITVLFFSGQQGDGFFKGIMRTFNVGNLIYTALTTISSFADIISYIRLFAVGLASVEIARSFNSMAQGIMETGSVFAIVGGIFVLIIGHSLNVVMGSLSVLVHGIRLKMLEFSGHLGNEWMGFAYKPFGRI